MRRKPRLPDSAVGVLTTKEFVQFALVNLRVAQMDPRPRGNLGATRVRMTMMMKMRMKGVREKRTRKKRKVKKMRRKSLYNRLQGIMLD